MSNLLGLGSAPVDVLVEVSESVISEYELNKGDFNQLSHDQFVRLAKEVGVGQLRSGGSVANTIWTASELGLNSSMLSYVGDDPAGRHFYKDMNESSVAMPEPEASRRTMEVYCLITPDGERTFACELTSSHMSAVQVREDMIQSADWLLIEGYFMTGEMDAVDQAILLARKHGKKIALTVSAPFVLHLCFDSVASELLKGVDLLVANDEEMKVLMEKSAEYVDADMLIEKIEMTPRLVTHSGDGATFVSGDDEYFEPSLDGVVVKDATGAGDAFLAGFLTNYVKNPEWVSVALRQGHQLGAAVVQQVGGRLLKLPEVV